MPIMSMCLTLHILLIIVIPKGLLVCEYKKTIFLRTMFVKNYVWSLMHYYSLKYHNYN